ncbi:conserved hypothetical protein [Microcystis aeruginosa PCC 9432]|uniref:Uncharacterized protein n=1 Tax=Microcystis aeruginosa PCC 9432 TaxID=1160280 RepID=A0A822L4D9_MICAE|nr:conserved hypothetical protein [Microcystis aeruginosa PCC 9432]
MCGDISITISSLLTTNTFILESNRAVGETHNEILQFLGIAHPAGMTRLPDPDLR